MKNPNPPRQQGRAGCSLRKKADKTKYHNRQKQTKETKQENANAIWNRRTQRAQSKDRKIWGACKKSCVS
jgi:hypothetical protein